MTTISAGTAFINILADMSAFGRSIESGLARARPSMLAAGKDLTKYVTLPILGVAAASIKLATDFEKTMAQIVGLAGQSEKQVDAWGKSILELAPKLGRAPQELAEALYFVASSGIEASKAMSVVEVSAKAAAAGLGDTQTVADAVTSAMNAYATTNLTAAHATDVLVQAVKLGKGEASAIAPVLGSLLPTASELGIKFEDVAAGLASMTLTGDDAALASTKLNAIMSGLLKVTPQSEKAFEAVGLSVESLRDSLGERGLLPTLNDIKKAVGDNTSALATMFPNVRALRGVLALTGNNAENVKRVFDEMANSTGALDDAFKAVSESAQFKMDQALAQIKSTLISLGQTLLPLFVSGLELVGKVFADLQNIPAPFLDFIKAVAGAVAAIGPLLLLFAGMSKALGYLKTAIFQVRDALFAMYAHPVIAGLALLAATVLIIVKAMGEGERAHNAFLGASLRSGKALVEFAGQATKAAAVSRFAFKSIVKDLTEPLRELGADTSHVLRDLAKGGIKSLKDLQNIAGETGQKIKEALALYNQQVATGLREGNISIQGAVLAWQGLGFEGKELQNRLLGVLSSIESFDVSDLVDGAQRAGLSTAGFTGQITELVNEMARTGQVTRTEYIDALVKLGVPLERATILSGAFKDTFKGAGAAIDATGKKINIFTFKSLEEFNKWVDTSVEGFESWIDSQDKLKQAFKLTTNELRRQMEERAKIALQAVKDIKELDKQSVPEEFKKWLVEQGPDTIHAYVEGSKKEQKQIQGSWEDIDKATGQYKKTLQDMPDITTDFKANTKPARDSANKLMDDLGKMGFHFNPQTGGLVVGGQLRHGGGMAGGGRWAERALKPGEVASILQSGEFVVQKGVVSKPGMEKFLTMLNAGEFHSGGMVGDNRANMIQMMGLQNTMRTLSTGLANGNEATTNIRGNFPTAEQFIEKLIGSITGGSGLTGLTPNAARYAGIIRAVFGNLPMGGVSVRKIAGTDTWSQHAYGNAVDVMTGTSDTLRKSVADFSNAQRSMLSIAHLLADPWYQSPRGDHYNHVHADFNPQGRGTPTIAAAGGFFGKLLEDTIISAHAGEFVNITPKGQTKGLATGMLDTKMYATVQREMEKLGASAEKVFGVEVPKAYEDDLKAFQKTYNEKNAILQKHLNEAVKTFDKLKEKVDSFKDAIRSGFGDTSSLISGALDEISKHAETLAGLREQGWTGEDWSADIGGFLAAQVASAQEFGQKLAQLAGAGLAPSILAELAAGGQQSLPLVDALLAGGKDLIKQFNDANKTIAEFANATADALSEEKFGGAIKRVGNKFENLGNQMDHLTDMLARIVNRLEGLGKGIHVPGFATGGIVRRPTLAMVGENGPEAIIPLSGRAGGGGLNVFVTVEGNAIYSRDLAAEVRDVLLKDKRFKGTLGLG